MATCTIARVRSFGLLPTSLATRALVSAFQSVTTSARVGVANSAAAIMPGSKVAGAFSVQVMGVSLWSTARRPDGRRGWLRKNPDPTLGLDARNNRLTRPIHNRAIVYAFRR